MNSYLNPNPQAVTLNQVSEEQNPRNENFRSAK